MFIGGTIWQSVILIRDLKFAIAQAKFEKIEVIAFDSLLVPLSNDLKLDMPETGIELATNFDQLVTISSLPFLQR